MATKQVAARQYQAIVDRAAETVAAQLTVPPEGWLATARQALGMSGAQLARRLGLKRGRIAQAEKAELSGGVTLRAMRTTAAAMGCRFVYAIVPSDGRIEDVVAAQADKKARKLVATASTHMALERQSLSDAQNRAEVERIAAELMRARPRDFWTDE